MDNAKRWLPFISAVIDWTPPDGVSVAFGVTCDGEMVVTMGTCCVGAEMYPREDSDASTIYRAFDASAAQLLIKRDERHEREGKSKGEHSTTTQALRRIFGHEANLN